MKHILRNVGLTLLLGMTVAWLAGCGQSGTEAAHDHEGHNHDHEATGGEEVVAALGDTETAAQKAAYPVKTCLVGGEELGSMGDPVEYVHEGRLVQFCCESCIDDFKKEPSKYLAILDEAAAKAPAVE